MYNVYVTNKSDDIVCARLKPQELSSLHTNFHQELHTLVSKGDTDESYIQTFLVRWGFRLIPPHETLSFATVQPSGNGGTHIMYASLYAASELWVMDEEVEFLKFGCLFIKSVSVPNSKIIFSLSQVNPEPLWIRSYQNNPFPKNAIKASSNWVVLYFGRSRDGVPCGVSTGFNYVCHTWNEGDKIKHISGEILEATGHQLYRVKSGDPVPPKAVAVGVSDTQGWLYLGRAQGRVSCSVSTEDGKIKQFFYPTGDETRFECPSGEFLVLTNDDTA